MYDDAAEIVALLKYHDNIYTNLAIGPHGPFNFSFFMLGAALFGISGVGLRFTLFLLSMVYLPLLYFFTKYLLGKKVACYAVLLNLFTFFAFYNSFITESDGVIQSIFSIIIFFSLILFLQSERKKRGWFLLSIAAYAFLVGAMKYRTGLLIIPLFLYIWYETKKFRLALFYSLFYVIPALFVLLMYIPFFYWSYGDMAPALLKLISAHNKISIDFIQKFLHPQTFSTTIIALTPLFLLALLPLKRWKRTYALFYFWLIMGPIYFILVPYNFPYIKYIAGFLLPPLTILCASAIEEEKIKEVKWVLATISILLLSFVFIFLNNTIPTDYWFFLSDIGPVVKVWQPLIYSVFSLCFLLFLYILFKKNSALRESAFILFLVLALSFNILMITDPIVDQEYQQMIKEIQLYAASHDLGQVYAWNEDVALYVGNIGWYIRAEDELDYGQIRYDNPILREYIRSTGLGKQGFIDLNTPLEKLKPYITEKGGTVFLLNYPHKYVVTASQTNQETIAFIDSFCTKEYEHMYKTASLVIYHC